MRLLFISVMFLALSGAVFPQDNDLMQDAITKPVMSLRCKQLFKERDEKIRVKQRLNALLQRNESLVRKTPENQKTLVAQNTATGIKLKQQIDDATDEIAKMEENIVRSGCPGLSL